MKARCDVCQEPIQRKDQADALYWMGPGPRLMVAHAACGEKATGPEWEASDEERAIARERMFRGLL